MAHRIILSSCLLLATICSAQTCSVPSYSCAYTGTNTVVTSIAPFDTTTPANTVIIDPLANLHILRLTDTLTGCPSNKAVETTWSGGSNEVMFNTNSTLIAIKCTGGVTHVIGFNPYTFRAWTTGESLTSCSGANTFSRGNPNIWYCLDGTTVYSYTFLGATNNPCGHGTCPDPTIPAIENTVLDFSNCLGATATKPTWNGILSIGEADSPFVISELVR